MSGLRKRKESGGTSMQFDDQGDEDFSEIEIKIKEELRKE